jgi:myo-inositol-1(or 4)-monophosphatase
MVVAMQEFHEATGAGTPARELDLLAIAHRAALASADELMARFGREAAGVRWKSSPTDLVSAADLAAEAAIRSVLARERPDDAILGEEGGASDGADGGDGLRWIVDPLDGTVNYLYGIPQFAVSVACEDPAGALAGVVLNPVTGETFAATRSGEATLNGSPIAGSGCDELSRALVATGFGYDAEVRAAQARVLTRLLPRVGNVRRMGAAALDMCDCARGRFDAYFERGIKAWDIAAGSLICTRAGLEVRMLDPVGILPQGILVAPSSLLEDLLGLVDGPPPEA